MILLFKEKPLVRIYVVSGDLPEDETTGEVGMSLSVNNDESEEVSTEKSGGITLEPVSISFANSHTSWSNNACTQVDLKWNRYAEEKFKYYDEALVKNCRDEDKVCVALID